MDASPDKTSLDKQSNKASGTHTKIKCIDITSAMNFFKFNVKNLSNSKLSQKFVKIIRRLLMRENNEERKIISERLQTWFMILQSSYL
jgi:hypothetical protein